MPVAQLSVLKYQLNPQIGLKATKNAVTGRPSRKMRISAAASELRPSRRRIAKPKGLSSQPPISQSAARFIGAVPGFVPSRSDHATRSTGLVNRLQRRRAGRMRSVAKISVIKRSPAVATKGELMPSKLSDMGIRPAWIARETTTRVNIHMRTAGDTGGDATA